MTGMNAIRSVWYDSKVDYGGRVDLTRRSALWPSDQGRRRVPFAFSTPRKSSFSAA